MRENFVQFELERHMSIWENQVEYNLSESGVHPMTITGLVDDPQMIEELLTTELNYPQTNGTTRLRETVAALYPGASMDNVLITTGAAQANYTSILTLMDPDEEIVIMLPNYMQIWGIAQNLGLRVKTFSLKEELDWAFDSDELQRTVTSKTKMIAICNPNNPTGHIMSSEERDAVVNAADRVGAWILSDEVYAGAEHNTDVVTPSIWGHYDKVLAVGSLSKAYALPGLRIGWVVAPATTSEEIWARQDYVTIGSTMMGNVLGAYALSPPVRARILARTRKYLRDGYRTFEKWCRGHAGAFSWVPPQAAAIVFVRYHQDVNSTLLIDRLIQEQQAYVIAGDHFGLDRHLRISYGLPPDYVNKGLDRLFQALISFD